MSSHTQARWFFTAALAWLAAPLANIHAQAPSEQKAATKASQKDLRTIAEEAYIYGYPLVLMDVTEKAGTNVPSPEAHRAPPNQFARVDVLPDAKFTSVVLPNVDTLYTSAFLDLEKEPLVLHVPDTQGRYYLMPMLDAYTNVFASPGKRTTGTKEGNFAIMGPHWKGELPAGVEKIEAPTKLVWVLGRTQINGKDDLPAATALAKQYTLTPLSSFGRSYSPPRSGHVEATLDMNTPPPRLVANMGDQAFFDRLAILLGKYPPPARDEEALAMFTKLGLEPGKFAPSPAATKAIQGASERAAKRIKTRGPELGRVANTWKIDTTLGSYGTRYLDRAAVALWGLGANLPEDAVYPSVTKDADGKALSGKNRYTLHFAKGQEPPANAFWSLTMYGMDNYLVANPIDRFAIGSRDSLKRNPDASLDIIIQHDKPSDDMFVNWLPSPAGPFQMLLRIYWPKDTLLNGSWTPPPVTRAAR